MNFLLMTAALLAGPQLFDRADENGDGALTQNEMIAQAIARFEESDLNGDGVVTKDELRALREDRRSERRAKWAERGEKAREKADVDGDGLISREEFLARADARFDRLDKDGDGALSDDEGRRRGRHR